MGSITPPAILNSTSMVAASLTPQALIASESSSSLLVVVVDVLLLLDHLLDVLHGLRGLNLKRDGVSLQGD